MQSSKQKSKTTNSSAQRQKSDIKHIENLEFRALVNLINNYSESPVAQNTTITAYVFSVMQMISKAPGIRAPSIMLITPSDQSSTPTYDLLNKLTPSSNYHYEKSSMRIEPCEVNQAAGLMAYYYEQRNTYNKDTAIKSFHKVREIGFGKGIKCPYTDAWHTKLGLITAPNKHNFPSGIVLTLTSEHDIETFRSDVFSCSNKLTKPKGPGLDLNIEYKTISVLASLQETEFKRDLTLSLLKQGNIPICIPCLKNGDHDIGDIQNLELTTRLMQKSLVLNGVSKPVFSDNTWLLLYYEHLYSRLVHLPQESRLPILKLVDQLCELCFNIVEHTIRFHSELPPNAQNVADFVLMHTMRGLTLNIIGLAFIGIGFKSSCTPKQLDKVLLILRKHHSMTKRSLQRKARFKSAKSRDLVLKELEAEALIMIDGNTVRALTLEEYTRSLHQRPDLLPVPVLNSLS